jgi:hypothetical protein
VSDAPEPDFASDDVADVTPNMPGVSLFDLRFRHCRCVVGHDGLTALYCGEPTISEASAWCAEHYKRFIRKQ